MAYPAHFPKHDYYLCFQLNGLVYLPHFEKPVWVSPGFFKSQRIYTEDQLKMLGASKTVRSLWMRPHHEPITHLEGRNDD